LSITPDNNTSTSRTEVSYGAENAVKLFSRVVSGANRMIDVCDDYVISYTPASHKVIKNRVLEVKAKFRYITEVRKDNIPYCKELMEIGQVRHLNGIRTNFVVTDTEYTSSVIMPQVHAHPEIVYSNVRSIVEQQRYLFENLWNKSISAEEKIREIEHGIMPIRTTLLENQEEIIKELARMNNSSNKLSICTSIGGMQMSYKYLFDSYKNILAKYNTGESKEGIRYLLNIENKEESTNLIKILLNSGIQIRHIKDRPPLSFGVSDKEVAATIEKMDGGKQSENFLISSEPLYVKHFSTIFEELWRNGIDATDRIRDIEEGVILAEVEVIENPKESLDRAMGISNSAKGELSVLFSTPNSFQRQVQAGLEYRLNEYIKRRIRVRLLIPFHEKIANTVAELKYKYPQIDFKNLDTSIQTKMAIVLVDRKECLLVETKDDTKNNHEHAAGISMYSDSKSIVSSYVSIFESLWRQSELYEQVKISERIQKDFINIAAHELRSPIQPILGLSEILSTMIKDSQQLELLQVINRNAKRLQRLTEDILDVTRIESQSLIIKKVRFNIIEVIQSTIADSTKAFGGKKLKVKLLGSEEAIFVEADKGRITQVIANILNNAIRFTQDTGGEIRVNAEKKEDIKEVLVEIKDTGEGIDSEVLPRLFSKFATKSIGGSGLGLYISKSIVEAHGGRIWAENNSDSDGATLTFSLPIT
jgi:two-component system, OmpR family, sensor histidine kinase VicK